MICEDCYWLISHGLDMMTATAGLHGACCIIQSYCHRGGPTAAACIRGLVISTIAHPMTMILIGNTLYTKGNVIVILYTVSEFAISIK